MNSSDLGDRPALVIASFIAGLVIGSVTVGYLINSNKSKINNKNGGGSKNSNSSNKDRKSEDGVESDEGSDDEHDFETDDFDSGEEVKMMLCVRTDLKMGKGKMVAQACHAAVGAYQRAKSNCPTLLARFDRCGCAKVAVKIRSEAELLQLGEVARYQSSRIVFNQSLLLFYVALIIPYLLFLTTTTVSVFNLQGIKDK